MSAPPFRFSPALQARTSPFVSESRRLPSLPWLADCAGRRYTSPTTLWASSRGSSSGTNPGTAANRWLCVQCYSHLGPRTLRLLSRISGQAPRARPELRRLFESSVFTATTYNFGLQTTSFLHYDFANFSYGWCAITALGDYDYHKGGHLVLWDIQLIIESPRGMTILIPSAILTHSNVAIQKHEARYSVVQYSAGALFRWVENSPQKAEDFYTSLTPEQVLEEAEDVGGLDFDCSVSCSSC
ncbi:hypothetical protein NLJ89_g11719 [Agrocybe chaxingu]|uniref:Uncharacterized protein n=1 Tax=Agrocybe chaxingu TaxID=84603 RepID=A0A9W8JRU6_9AGAR|nr:hypothetical protein NLJ89_g11719 [Agrocybe chaxingu]